MDAENRSCRAATGPSGTEATAIPRRRTNRTALGAAAQTSGARGAVGSRERELGGRADDEGVPVAARDEIRRLSVEQGSGSHSRQDRGDEPGTKTVSTLSRGGGGRWLEFGASYVAADRRVAIASV